MSRSYRALPLALLATVVLAQVATAQVAATAAGALRWYVDDEADIESWQRAAEGVWGDGALAVERWVGQWPPSPDWRLAHAYLEGTPQRGVVVLRRGDGVQRRLPAVSGGDDEAARRAVMLLLSSIYVPLEVTDQGWQPEPKPEPEPHTPVPIIPSETIEPTGPPRLLRVGIAVGAANRVGMKTGALAWRFRLGVDAGDYRGRRSPRLRFVAEITGEHLGLATIDSRDIYGRTVDEVDVRFDGISVGGGVEGRLGNPDFAFVSSVVLAARQSWSWLSLDEDQAGQETPGFEPVPQLRVSAGVNLRLRGETVRWGFHGVLAQELFKVQPGWVFYFEQRYYWGPRSTSFHLLVELDFGGGRRPARD